METELQKRLERLIEAGSSMSYKLWLTRIELLVRSVRFTLEEQRGDHVTAEVLKVIEDMICKHGHGIRIREFFEFIDSEKINTNGNRYRR